MNKEIILVSHGWTQEFLQKYFPKNAAVQIIIREGGLSLMDTKTGSVLGFRMKEIE